MTTFAAPPSVTLYQYAICPFCNKTKVLLRYLGLPYQTVEVNPLTKKQLKPWSGAYQKVPIAIIDGHQINGSDEIASNLLHKNYVHQVLHAKWTKNGVPEISPMTMSLFTNGTSPNQTSITEFENNLAAILYPNIARTWTDSYHAFSYVDSSPNTFSHLDKFLIRNIGSLAMTFAAHKIKKKRGIQDERQALLDALLQWERDGIQNGTVSFSSGLNHPSMMDLNVFGVLNSCRNLPFLEEMIYGHELIFFGKWYRRMIDITTE